MKLEKISSVQKYLLGRKRGREMKCLMPSSLRFVIAIGYINIIRLGLSMASTIVIPYNSDIISPSHNVGKLLDSIKFMLLVYGVETICAVCFSWVSQYKHRVKHIVEHHGMACIVMVMQIMSINAGILEKNLRSELQSNLIEIIACTAFLSQVCEFWWVLRTFLSIPDSWYVLLIQRLLGLIFMGAISLVGTSFLLVSLYDFLVLQYKCESIEILMKIAMVYFFMYLNPIYLYKHIKVLRRLF